MSRRPRRRPRRPSPRMLAVPGPWESVDRPPRDPGAGFTEVAMVALNAPDAPPACRGYAAQLLCFHEVTPAAPCPCGSGKSFDACHRNSNCMPILCRDIGAETYSEIAAYETTFPVRDDEAAVRRLKAAPELRLTQEIPGRLFWQFIGDPPLETPVGDMVFATVEWNPGRLYFVTLSRQRSEVIILTLVARAGETLGTPFTQRTEVESQYRQMLTRQT